MNQQSGVVIAATYNIGDRPTIISYFKDSEGQPADPTTIIFKIRKPNGGDVTIKSEADATRVALGEWHWLIPAAFDESGIWWVLSQATAPFESAEEMALAVAQTRF